GWYAKFFFGCGFGHFSFHLADGCITLNIPYLNSTTENSIAERLYSGFFTHKSKEYSLVRPILFTWILLSFFHNFCLSTT
ncbi:unnamed protein product, partial [Prunus brigantina]